MRIIRGKYKGRRIYPPKNFNSRPTTDFAKEALFQLIENEYNIEESDVLDLFAGTGNISYEFLSRACKSITSVEKNKRYAEFIKKNSENFFGGEIHVVNYDAFLFTEKNSLKYDIIFADPPFDIENITDLPTIIFNNETVKENTVIIIEHSKSIDFSDCPQLIKTRNYGKVFFSFFSNNK